MTVGVLHNARMTDPAFNFSVALQGACPLSELGIIGCQGADSVTFLHNQLTQDLIQLPIGQSRLAGFCNAQGRLQASFIGYKKSTEEVWLIAPKSMIERTIKRLSMFVLRAKTRLIDISHQQSIWGLAGDLLTLSTGQPLEPWQTVDATTTTGKIIGLYPACGQARALLLPQGDVSLTPSLPWADWQTGEVLAGVAMVQPETFEAFVPQMLNFESVGGVHFQKGCFPGQEVVARSQFRGTIKRRTFLVRSPLPLEVGAEVWAGTESCGLVALAARLPQGGGVALVCMLLSLAASPDLHVAGVPLQVLPLPYPLRQDL